MAMTAEEAYAEAERRIEKLRGERGEPVLSLKDLKMLEALPPLHDLPNLHELNLDNTQIADITPLQGLTGLRTLYLDMDQLTDITPLQGLTGLQTLFLCNTQVADITPLKGLTGLQTLHLYNTQVADITPIKGLTGLQLLTLDNTHIADIAPLRDLTGLQHIDLDHTQVTDITPLQGLTELQTLYLDNTQVADLRPIAALPWTYDSNAALPSSYDPKDPLIGIFFQNTPAAAASPELTELAALEDDHERTDKTLAYLRSLPPYPAPLPWEKSVPNAPAADSLPQIVICDDQIDVAHVPPDENDLDDPIKARMYARLQSSVADLLRLGNQYPEISSPANALTQIFATPFEDADLFDIHLEIAILTDLVEKNADRAEPLDADCLHAVKKVTQLGPPLTLGNADVELFEARNLQYAQQKRDEAIANSERAMAQALIDSPLLTERAAHFAGIAVDAPTEGRTASYRVSFIKNVILRGVAELSKATAIVVWSDETIAALEFIQLNRDLILTIATSWGEQGHIWAADFIARSGEALRKYRT